MKLKLKSWPVIVCGAIVFGLGYNEVKKGGGVLSSATQLGDGGIKEILIDTTNTSIADITQDIIAAFREGRESQKEIREQVAGFAALTRKVGSSKRVNMCANNSLIDFTLKNEAGETLGSGKNMLLGSFKANKLLYALLQSAVFGMGKNGVVSLIFTDISDFQPFLIGREKAIINGSAMVDLTLRQINGKVAFEPGSITFIKGENKNNITGARNLWVLCGETININYTLANENTEAVLLESAAKFRLGEESEDISLILEYLVMNSGQNFEARLPSSLGSRFIKGINTPVIIKGTVRKTDE